MIRERAADYDVTELVELGDFLISDYPILLLPKLACTVGLNEAIVLQQLFYWLKDKRRRVIDGKRWVYNTYAEWREQFPWWSERTIQRIFLSLEKSGLVLSADYNENPWEHVKWYTINPDGLARLRGQIGAGNPDNLAASDHDNLAATYNRNTETNQKTTTETNAPKAQKPLFDSAEQIEPKEPTDTEIAQWPEWYALGYGIQGWVVSFADAEAWRVKQGIPQELMLTTVYGLRDWWHDTKRRGTRKNPWLTFQNWARKANEERKGTAGQPQRGRASRPAIQTNGADLKSSWGVKTNG